MKLLINTSLLYIIILSLYSPATLAWGKTGHRIVAEIAQRNLDLKILKEIKDLMGDEDLSRASNWPDEIRSNSKYNYTWPWHYVSIPNGKSYFDQKRKSEGDVIESLFRNEDILRDLKAPKEQRIEALRFVIHFLADLHQPLHVGIEEDRGGNSIRVKWFKTETNLHTVWDEEIIDFEKLSFTEYSTYLNHFSDDEKKDWQKGQYLDWAKESQELRPKVYDMPENKSLSFEYGYKAKPIVEQRLKQAGLRLAYVLSHIFSQEKQQNADFEIRKKIKENI
jgi:hypothetical protein